jgi:hypothetical protein
MCHDTVGDPNGVSMVGTKEYIGQLGATNHKLFWINACCVPTY